MDLISEDKELYVQVTTTKDLNTKIRETLENIRDSDNPEAKNIRNIIFFVLENDNVESIQDFCGEKQIGNIEFTKENNLITTRDIIKRAKDCTEFQIALYNLLKKESENVNDISIKLCEQINNSKCIGLKNIDGLINNEYKVDRSELINLIKGNNDKFICVQGIAGSGKSSLCKELIENEANILYARAERFIEENNIDSIWGFNVETALCYLNNNPIIFFIDSLEFISDIRTKLDLLSELYEICVKHSNVKIITSCRSSDSNAFIKINKNYCIKIYEVPELQDSQIRKISEKYDIIFKMNRSNKYNSLLKIPFYINLIVTRIDEIDRITDENELRSYIWENVICMKKDLSKYNLKYHDIVDTVKNITFDRAKKFELGVREEEYDFQILKALISENVVTSSNGLVRLKYDIFEDICFENYFDNKFNEYKGNYAAFFKEIEQMGRCLNRRYQIWIENKLFAKDNREKFLYQLVFSNKIPEEWKLQTKIGLIKSKYSSAFFQDYKEHFTSDKIIEFVKIINLYGFEPRKDVMSKVIPYVILNPVGQGREQIIKLIYDSRIYSNQKNIKNDILKMISDYANQENKNSDIATCACFILQFWIKEVEDRINDNYYVSCEEINKYLNVIYSLSKYCEDWLTRFFGKIIPMYKGDLEKKSRFAEEIIENTLDFKNASLIISFPKTVCDLAELFWTTDRKLENISEYGMFLTGNKESLCKMYGLSKNAEYYEHKCFNKDPRLFNIVSALLNKNFWYGFEWIISFINNAVFQYSQQDGILMSKIKIKFFDINGYDEKEFMGTEDMWLAGINEGCVPMLIGDMIFILIKKINDVLSNLNINNDVKIKFANSVKKIIYEKSNNIILLSAIYRIGVNFCDIIPGYAVDLVTSIDLIKFDMTRKVITTPNLLKEKLTKQIWKVVGLPNEYKERYIEEDYITLRDYSMNSQMFGSHDLKIKCKKIINYLYELYSDRELYRDNILHIENMDCSKAKIGMYNDDYYVVPTLSESSNKIVEEYSQVTINQKKINEKLGRIFELLNSNSLTKEECMNMIDELITFNSQDLMGFQYDEHFIILIMYMLSLKEITLDERDKLCRVWIERIKSLFNSGNFIFDTKNILVLCNQLDSDISNDTKNEIKLMILNFIMYSGNSGVIYEIKSIVRAYLKTNEKLSRCLLNTIIKLSEDEMNHQVYNAKYLKKSKERKQYKFIPNLSPRLHVVDNYIRQDNKETYASKYDAILEKYLYQEKHLEIKHFNIAKYDVSLLCLSVNTGMSIKNSLLKEVVKSIVKRIMEIWNLSDVASSYVIDYSSVSDLKNFLQNELVISEETAEYVFDILIDSIDFELFGGESKEFYLDIFYNIGCEFFDSYDDKDRRQKCKNIIKLLEHKIEKITNINIKKEMYKYLIFPEKQYMFEDWSKYNTEYDYNDKMFLNDLFSKYGLYYPKQMIRAVYRMNINKLFPEILLSINDVFQSLKNDDEKKLLDVVYECKNILVRIISIAFLEYGDVIKRDLELTESFTNILNILIIFSFQEAATILDEFLIH